MLNAHMEVYNLPLFMRNICVLSVVKAPRMERLQAAGLA
jgi:hypothetical protein